MRSDVTASIVVLRENEILLLRRDARWSGIFDYVLEIPGGGVEKGETPEQAAKRELFEETGLRADALQYLGGVVVIDRRALRFINVFLARTNGDPTASKDPEHAGYQWVSLDALQHMQNLSYTTIAAMDLLNRWGIAQLVPPEYFEKGYQIFVATPRGIV